MRPLNINDLDTVHTYASDSDNTRYMVWLPNDTKEETASFLLRVAEEWKKERPSFYEFAITLDGVQIGAISCYFNEARDEAELGWIINKQYWKKGYAAEAAFAIKDFAINELNVKRLTANCDYRNSDSYRLMKKIGLKLKSDSGTRTYHKSGETSKEFEYSLTVDQI